MPFQHELVGEFVAHAFWTVTYHNKRATVPIIDSIGAFEVESSVTGGVQSVPFAKLFYGRHAVLGECHQ